MEMSGRNAQEIVPCHAHASPGDAAMPSGPSDHVRAQANFLEFPPLVQKILLCGPTTGRVAQSNVSPSMKNIACLARHGRIEWRTDLWTLCRVEALGLPWVVLVPTEVSGHM